MNETNPILESSERIGERYELATYKKMPIVAEPGEGVSSLRAAASVFLDLEPIDADGG